MTTVFYHKTFRKKYPKMPQFIQQAFKERLNIFLQNPFHPLLNNHNVNKAYPGCRSINLTGDYRAIFEHGESFIKFVNIGSHSELYN